MLFDELPERFQVEFAIARDPLHRTTLPEGLPRRLLPFSFREGWRGLTVTQKLWQHALYMEADTSVSYRFWGADSIAYGPVELPGLVTWIKQGKVGANTWVFKEMDGTWTRAAGLPELQALFKSKLPPSTAAAASATGIQPGSLRRIKMLADVDERLLASLLSYLEVVRVPAFGTVVNKGDQGDAMFMVLEGELRARVMIEGRETTLANVTLCGPPCSCRV